MKLDGPQRKALREILLEAFDRVELKRGLAESSPSRELENLVSPGSFSDEVFELISQAERGGWLDQIQKLLEQEVPGREDLITRVRGIFEPVRERGEAIGLVDPDPPDPEPVAPDPPTELGESSIRQHIQDLLDGGDFQKIVFWCSRIIRTGSFAEAVAINQRMIDLAGSDDQDHVAGGYENLGDVYRSRGSLGEARHYWSRSLVLYRQLGRGDKVAELEKKLKEPLPVPPPPPPPPIPLRLFYSYAHEDESLRDQLATHLSLLEHEGAIRSWHDRGIDPGIDWDREINQQLLEADIILLLVSADFLASDYIRSHELRVALERHESREARVIPIILRPTDWKSARFSRLQALPRDGRAVTSWSNTDEAFADIARALRKIAQPD